MKTGKIPNTLPTSVCMGHQAKMFDFSSINSVGGVEVYCGQTDRQKDGQRTVIHNHTCPSKKKILNPGIPS